MDDKLNNAEHSVEELSDDLLESVVGGRMTAGDCARFDEFVRMCKYYGVSLDEAIEQTRKSFKKPQAQVYVEEYVAYIRQIW